MSNNNTGDLRQSLRQRIERICSGQQLDDIRSSIRDLLGADPGSGDILFASKQISRLLPEHAANAGLKTVRTFIARSITVEPLVPHLLVHSAAAGFRLEVEIGGYGSFAHELMDASSSLHKFSPDLVLLLLDTEDIAAEFTQPAFLKSSEQLASDEIRVTSRIEGLLRSFRSHSSARLVVQGFALPAQTALGAITDANLPSGEHRMLQVLNNSLSAICRKLSDCVYFDQDQLASAHGRLLWRDERMFRTSRVAVAAQFFSAYAAGLTRSFAALYRPVRKVLCTDLDNTLWGGILGEDGPFGIATGAQFPGNCYSAYQKYLKTLSQAGILLAAVSKNNESDVSEVFQLRRSDFSLLLDDFVALKIGWDDKVSSLKALASELSLGLDSFVFVDDNPVECAAIRQQLPEVAVIEADPAAPWLLVPRLVSACLFDFLKVTDDDRARTADYRAQVERAALETSGTSKEDFLASLGMECTILSALEAPLERSAQLLSKTNQFNLTTRRHSATAIQHLASQPGNQAIAVRVNDRFGDSGVVGVALCVAEDSACIIDTLLLSCRVIGRGVETAILSAIAQNARDNGATRLLGHYIPTKKNAPCADFYPSHGFRQLRILADGGIEYELDISCALPQAPAWIAMKNQLHKDAFA
jgi:FkbH-like protein